jgi:hypothetical protein
MTQSFVGTREQVLSALMHANRQSQRQRRNSRLWSLRTVRTCDCHSAWVRTPIRAFPPSYRAAQLSGYLRQRNSVTGDCCGDAGRFSTLRTSARERTPTNEIKGNSPHLPCYCDDRGGIHAQDLDACYHIRRFVPVHYWSPCGWYMVRPLRHWLGRDELRFLLI